MERNEIIQKVVEAIKKVLGASNVNANFAFSEDVQLFQTGLEFSSIDGVMLVVELEKIFGIQWPDELLTFNDILTIGQVIDIIDHCLKEKKV